jgi:outer membrane protein assembly factor BamB
MRCTVLVLLCFCSIFPGYLPAQGLAQNQPTAWSFPAGDSPVYHLRTIRQQPNTKDVVTASLDGTTACFSPEGKPIWTSKGAGGFPFDLAAADIDGDGLDEVLVASGDGSLYAYDQDGTPLWRFERKAPFYQVCVAQDKQGKAIILAGGVEQVLYALSPKGAVLNTLKTEHCIRHLRTGNVLGNGNDYLAMATASSGLNGSQRLFLLDPHDLSVRWQRTDLHLPASKSSKRFVSMLLTDLDRDGKEEVLMGGYWGERGMLVAFKPNGELLFSKSDQRVPRIAYRMNLLRPVKVPGDEYLLGHFGNLLILYETDGRLRETLTGPYAFADSHFDPELKTLFMGSEVSGGTEIYAYRLDRPGWKEAFKTQKAHGRLQEIENNLAMLDRQIRAFKAPAYQPVPKKTLAITQIKDAGGFKRVEFARSITLSQKVANPNELWCRERDRRMPYKDTADELVKTITDKETKGENTLVWAGHGDAIYFPLSTFERLMNAGPKHLKGFVFAEMEGINESTREVVEKILLPLAELCRQHGKIIFFRNKNIFWNGTCYLPFWSKVLLNEKYKDVFVPALEETNCRTQELSLSGRIGLWQANYFTHWACRVVTDNANFDRMFEWGAQQVITHHLRNLVSTASMGADTFLCDLHAGAQTEALFEQLVPFYNMIEQGILQVPNPDQLISCSDFALVMKSPPSDVYLRHGINGHRYSFPQDQDPEMVFSRLDTYWGGSILPDYDFSAYAMNVKQRTCNFLPELPHGLIPIIPAHATKSARFRQTITTDGESFFDGNGKKHTATEFRPEVEKALQAAAARLPVTVAGKAHWSAVKMDKKHIRLTLVDPGYLDPSDRAVKIVFQHIKPTKCIDILSGETLKPNQDKLTVTVPAGIFRIIDLVLE